MAMGREGGWEWSVVALGIKFNPTPTPQPQNGAKYPPTPIPKYRKTPPNPKIWENTPSSQPQNLENIEN